MEIASRPGEAGHDRCARHALSRAGGIVMQGFVAVLLIGGVRETEPEVKRNSAGRGDDRSEDTEWVARMMKKSTMDEEVRRERKSNSRPNKRYITQQRQSEERSAQERVAFPGVETRLVYACHNRPESFFFCRPKRKEERKELSSSMPRPHPSCPSIPSDHAP